MAFASASNGPSGTHSFLLIAARHCPVWSRATTPILTASRCWNMAPSTFTLYLGLCGRGQVVCVAKFGITILWFASWYSSSWYSSTRLTANYRMTVLICRDHLVQVLLRFNHRLHAILTLKPSNSSLTCWLNTRCQRRSRKLSDLKLWLLTSMLDARQTSWALSHAYRACPIVSTPLP